MAAPNQNFLRQDGRCDWCDAHLPNGRRRGSPKGSAVKLIAMRMTRLCVAIHGV